MKLDENVCRGSLIFHKGARYVVLGRSEPYQKGLVTFRGYPVMRAEDVEAGVISYRQHVSELEDVEVFFPGVAYQLPDYIR